VVVTELPSSLENRAKIFWRPETPHPAAPDSIALVTAFFDIDRGAWSQRNCDVSTKYRRSLDFYFDCFANLAMMKNDLIVFTAPELAQRVLDTRKAQGLENRTFIFTVDRLFETPEVARALAAAQAQMTEKFKDFVWRPTAPEYNKADYVIVNALKSTFACTAIAMGAVVAPQLAWIDFGYARDTAMVESVKEWAFDFGDRINLFAIFRLDDRPIYDIVRRGEAYIQGCHIVGPTAAWLRFNRQISKAFSALIACGLIDDDQTLLLMAYRAAPELFTLRRHPTDPDYDWRFIFKRFQEGMRPLDRDLRAVADKGQPDWLRDLKTLIRRRLRAKIRAFNARVPQFPSFRNRTGS
jgi:protein YibB